MGDPFFFLSDTPFNVSPPTAPQGNPETPLATYVAVDKITGEIKFTVRSHPNQALDSDWLYIHVPFWNPDWNKQFYCPDPTAKKPVLIQKGVMNPIWDPALKSWSGIPIPSKIWFNWDEPGVWDVDDGILDLSLVPPGIYPIKISSVKYIDWIGETVIL
jgi:hypothetical protein